MAYGRGWNDIVLGSIIFISHRRLDPLSLSPTTDQTFLPSVGFTNLILGPRMMGPCMVHFLTQGSYIAIVSPTFGPKKFTNFGTHQRDLPTTHILKKMAILVNHKRVLILNIFNSYELSTYRILVVLSVATLDLWNVTPQNYPLDVTWGLGSRVTPS